MIIEKLKARARVLHRKVAAGDLAADERVRRIPELKGKHEAAINRRHCLTALARELGFDGWGHLTAVIEGAEVEDFGTLLYGPACGAHTNIWCADYDEARAIHQEKGGYLLPWRRQFLIADRHFIATLGLDEEDAAWAAMGHDWVRPRDVPARAWLYGVLIERRSQAA